jgi:hypothetical protein
LEKPNLIIIEKMNELNEYFETLNIKTETKNHLKADTCEVWLKYYPSLFPDSTGIKFYNPRLQKYILKRK